MSRISMPSISPGVAKFSVWGVTAAAIVGWVAYAGHHHWWRASLLTGLAAATFIVGALVGFVFTTYDEESSTVGKVKDWLIGSLAAITLVKFDSLKPILLAFTLHSTTAEFAFALSVSIVFAGLGFFFMFFGRELLFNVPLARERAERSRVETGDTSVITIHLLSVLPSSILVGTDDAHELLSRRPAEAKLLREQLNSTEVATFLQQSKDATAKGIPLDWDVVSKNAYLHYYRTYFAEAGDKPGQASTALGWTLRALVINPQHVDFTIKHADLLGMLERNHETVKVLERLHPLPECPAFVDQWLGHYLLLLRGREEDSIRCSSRYLAGFPESRESRRNLACAYALKVCRQHGSAPKPLDDHSDNYKEAIRNLRIAVDQDQAYLSTIREKWAAPDGPFACFRDDPEFRRIVEPSPDVPVNDTPADTRTGAPPRANPAPAVPADPEILVTEPVTVPSTGEAHQPPTE